MGQEEYLDSLLHSVNDDDSSSKSEDKDNQQQELLDMIDEVSVDLSDDSEIDGILSDADEKVAKDAGDELENIISTDLEDNGDTIDLGELFGIDDSDSGVEAEEEIRDFEANIMSQDVEKNDYLEDELIESELQEDEMDSDETDSIEDIMSLLDEEDINSIEDISSEEDIISEEDINSIEDISSEEDINSIKDISSEEDADEEEDTIVSLEDIINEVETLEAETGIKSDDVEPTEEEVASIVGEEEIDFMNMLNDDTEENEETDISDSTDGLFDDDLMKLLGEEELSGEDISSDEEELLNSLMGDSKEEKPEEAPAQNADTNVKKKGKGGFFSKLFKQSGSGDSNKEKDENEAILEELAKEDKNKDKKKAKKEKINKKPKKEKPAREKKPKKEKPVVIEEPSKPLPKGQVISIFILCISIGVFIILSSNFIPYNMDINEATRYYEREQYKAAYETLVGMELEESDKELLRKTQTIMFLQKHYDTYETYKEIGLIAESLDSLVKGVAKYDEHISGAGELGIATTYDSILAKIATELEDKYSISVDEARDINLSETSEEYSRRIYAIIE